MAVKKKSTPSTRTSASPDGAQAPTANASLEGADPLLALLEKHGLRSKARAILAVRENSIRLVSVPDGGAEVGASRLGGHPDLPIDFEWPKPGRRALSFVAQLNLSQLQPYDTQQRLPTTGVLSFFYDIRSAFRGKDTDPSKARVYWFSPSQRLEHRAPPKGVASWKQCGLRCFAELTLPFGRSSVAGGLGVENYFAFYAEARSLLREPNRDGDLHRVLGHPDAIQGDMTRRIVYELAKVDLRRPRAELEREARDLELLLQVDSDANAEMMWGDLGRLFFWNRKNDLAAANFETVYCLLQCG